MSDKVGLSSKAEMGVDGLVQGECKAQREDML